MKEYAIPVRQRIEVWTERTMLVLADSPEEALQLLTGNVYTDKEDIKGISGAKATKVFWGSSKVLERSIGAIEEYVQPSTDQLNLL